MAMKNPCHPGEIVREDVLAPLGLNVTEAAKALGVTRQALSNMLNGRTSAHGGDGAARGEGVRPEDGAPDADAAQLRSRRGPRPCR